MEILDQLYPFLIATAVFGFPDGFLRLFLGSLVLIDSVLLLMHLTLDYNFGYGFLLFGCVNVFCEELSLLLLVTLGIRFIYSAWCFRVFIPLLCNFRKKISWIFPESKLSGECDDNSDVEESAGEEDDDDEVDVLELKKLVKVERRRANEALAELEKEREASSIAAEETMALIRRLETKKSLLEMEFSHYRRLTEEEQSHYHEKIQSLQWLLFNLQEEQLRLSRQKLKVILQN